MIIFLFVVYSVTCAEISEDSSILAVGFSDSVVKLWSLMPQKLRAMKAAEILQEIDTEAGIIIRKYSLTVLIF